jgi:hypothetical protein
MKAGEIRAGEQVEAGPYRHCCHNGFSAKLRHESAPARNPVPALPPQSTTPTSAASPTPTPTATSRSTDSSRRFTDSLFLRLEVAFNIRWVNRHDRRMLESSGVARRNQLTAMYQSASHCNVVFEVIAGECQGALNHL